MHFQSARDLRQRYPAATQRVRDKELDHIDAHMARFIALSPLVVLASTDAGFQLDASPRGGAPGFVRQADAQTLLIPDFPGNNRLDSLTNIVETAHVGLLFMIPGVDEMLRINGQAQVSDEPAWLAHFSEGPRLPRTVVRVQVQRAYLHCAKAIMRARLWSPDSQVDRAVLPTMGEMIKDHAGLQGPAETQEEMLRRYAPDIE
jgi:PPOX class probable FMN-dependent enzyme